MWTPENRPLYDRDKLRYPSDLTDAEWQHIGPLLPPAKRGGGKRTVDMREVVNGVMYVLSTGCQWRYIPKDLPPRSTVHDYFSRWGYDGTLEKSITCREQDEADHRGRHAPSCVDERRRRTFGLLRTRPDPKDFAHSCPPFWHATRSRYRPGPASKHVWPSYSADR